MKKKNVNPFIHQHFQKHGIFSFQIHSSTHKNVLVRESATAGRGSSIRTVNRLTWQTLKRYQWMFKVKELTFKILA